MRVQNNIIRAEQAKHMRDLAKPMRSTAKQGPEADDKAIEYARWIIARDRLNLDVMAAAIRAENLAAYPPKIERDGYDSTRAGNDLWLTSQGHGVGFWDRSELDDGDLGDKLTAICQHNEAQLWFADHVEFGNAPNVYCDVSFRGKAVAQ